MPTERRSPDAASDLDLIDAALNLMPWSGEGRRDAKAAALQALDRLRADRPAATTQRVGTAKLCDKCKKATSTRGEDGRYWRFLHVRCFDSWWWSVYGPMKGSYYRWMREGMCVR